MTTMTISTPTLLSLTLASAIKAAMIGVSVTRTTGSVNGVGYQFTSSVATAIAIDFNLFSSNHR